MKSSRKRRLVLSDLRQREAIGSPIRMELLEHVRAVGPTTVARLAQRMGRTPHSLYHHLRKLVDVGIVRKVGNLRSGARDQALYDAVADLLEVPAGQTTPEIDRADCKTIGVILRHAEREFAAALKTHPTEIRHGKFFIGRMRAKISRQAQDKIRKHLSEIQSIFESELNSPLHPRSKARTCSLTVAFVPSPTSDEDA